MILANHPCPNCKAILECNGVAEGELIDCPQCGKPFEVPFLKRTTAHPSRNVSTIKSRSEIAGKGCVVQAIGLLACFFAFPLGLLVGVPLLVWGGAMAKKLVCGSCGNPVDSKTVKLCPVCRATLTY